jgi:nitrite reductase/ring-hydroxylating ferredoxin subunit
MDFHAPDGRAYMGKMMRGSDTLLTATGFNKWGLSAGSAASLVFRDHIMKGLPLPSGSAAVLPAASVAAGAGGSGGSGAASTTSAGGANASFSISAGALGDTADWAPYFAGERWDLAKALPGMISEGWHTTKHLVGDKLSHAIGKHRSPADLAPGEGDICHHAGKKVAAFRKDDGTLVACQAQCSHLGCDLMFNRADKTFDCPVSVTNCEQNAGGATSPSARTLGVCEHANVIE